VEANDVQYMHTHHNLLDKIIQLLRSIYKSRIWTLLSFHYSPSFW